jgi:hypothetical protein
MSEECQKYNEWLKDDQAGELDPTRQRELAEHVDGCGACARERSDLESAWKLLSEVRDEPVPQHFFVYEDSPGERGLVSIFRRFSLGWKVAFASVAVAFGLGSVLLLSQARIEVGTRSVALSFGPIGQDSTVDVENSQDNLEEAIRMVVREENERWAAQFRKEVETLIAQGSQSDRESFSLTLTQLERRFGDRLGAQEKKLQASFETALGESMDLLSDQRRSDAAQIRQVLGRFAAFNRFQAGQSTAIIETLTEIADNRNGVRGGAR